MIEKILHAAVDTLPQKRVSEHPDYTYIQQKFVPVGEKNQCTVSVYTVPPLKAAYPYHYHRVNEEVFYLISGHGILRTPKGERPVSAGDLLFFPANAAGAHKLTNCSATEPLVYLDVDTNHAVDVTIYPDSGKIGVYGKELVQVYRTADQVDYYEGE